MEKSTVTIAILLAFTANATFSQAIPKTMLRLPDTGQTGDYTATKGEDADYTIYPPFFIKNGNGTVTDTVTGLMWQQTDGGEMTFENAVAYCDALTLGGFTDWRLPNPHEAFSILNHGKPNPALDGAVFTSTGAEYWWTGAKQVNDSNKIWVTNAGGGIGNHLKTETISAGGSKKFHVWAVRDRQTPTVVASHFTDNGDGTITDNRTNLTWQKVPLTDSLTWEQALNYAENLSLAGKDDWRLPNIKELQSLSDEALVNPSISTAFFSATGNRKYWSSTSLPNQTTQAWYLDTRFGITTYELKTRKLYLICVRGPEPNTVAMPARRNVLLIIADDLGSDYCGFYENHLDTAPMPNVRRLLQRGVRFRNAWSNPLCSPTRAGILTGRYSFRTGVGDAVGAGATELDTAELTISRLLNVYTPNGIAKANIGKWHLHNPTPVSNWLFPNLMGYDHFSGSFSGKLPDYYNWNKVVDGMTINVPNYATTETVNDAVSWIKGLSGKPFFLWLAFNAPHAPYHLPPQDLHSYTNLSGTTADIDANPKPYFKASLEALDHEIGRLFDTLVVYNLWDSTDIIFIGDNGNDPAVAQNQGSAKGSIYQEGVGVPFIISGPAVVNPNRASDALVNTQDLFATILEMFGDTSWQSQIPAGKTVDSRSLMPLLKNKAGGIRPWVFTEVFKTPASLGDGKAIRGADFKLMHFDDGTQKFFNLTNDPKENENLLDGTLSADQLVNYIYLCNEMTKLVGNGTLCNLQTDTFNPDAKNATPQAIPNPFTARIYLEPSIGEAFTEMINFFGQVVFSGTNIETADFSNLPPGVYFLKIPGYAVLLKLIKA